MESLFAADGRRVLEFTSKDNGKRCHGADPKTMPHLGETLLPNLQHESHSIRLTTLKLLLLLHMGEDADGGDDKGSKAAGASVRRICCDLEQLPLALSFERLAVLKLTNLQVLARSQHDQHEQMKRREKSVSDYRAFSAATMTPFEGTLVASYCLGLLHRKFQPLWGAATATFAAVAETYPDQAWTALGACLQRTSAKHRSSSYCSPVSAGAALGKGGQQH